MAGSSQKRTTMAKLNREAALRERRARKQAKKDARKQARRIRRAKPAPRRAATNGEQSRTLDRAKLSVSGSFALPLKPTQAGRGTMGECDLRTAVAQRLIARV